MRFLFGISLFDPLEAQIILQTGFCPNLVRGLHRMAQDQNLNSSVRYYTERGHQYRGKVRSGDGQGPVRHNTVQDILWKISVLGIFNFFLLGEHYMI
jgi:hypothetical protein